MLAKFIAVASLVTFAVAGGTTTDSCNVEHQQCCNSVQDVKSAQVQGLAGILNIPISLLSGQAGINCSPLSVIGIGGNSCNAQPVCCTGNNYNGLVALGCSPLILNL